MHVCVHAYRGWVRYELPEAASGAQKSEISVISKATPSLKALGEDPSYLFQLLVVAGNPWCSLAHGLITSTLPHCHGTIFSVCVSPRS